MFEYWVIFWVSLGQPLLGAGILFELILIVKKLEELINEFRMMGK